MEKGIDSEPDSSEVGRLGASVDQPLRTGDPIPAKPEQLTFSSEPIPYRLCTFVPRNRNHNLRNCVAQQPAIDTSGNHNFSSRKTEDIALS